MYKRPLKWVNSNYTLTITVVDGAAQEIDLEKVNTKQENWDLGLTTVTCILYMGGATVATVGGQVSAAGTYPFDLGSRRVFLTIAPGSCQITIR